LARSPALPSPAIASLILRMSYSENRFPLSRDMRY
jgi:hypothetical protein